MTAGIALLLLCAAAFWLTTGFDEVPPMLAQNVPPSFFPRLLLAVIALLALVLIVSGTRRKADAGAAKIPGRVAATALVLVVTALLLPLLGGIATLMLAAVALPLLWGERRYLPVTLFAISLPVGVYLLFSLVLGVRFPPGPLARLFG